MKSTGAIWVMEPYDPSHETEGSDRYRGVDIRVDDSPDPFKELRRLLNITLAGCHSRLSRHFAQESKFAKAIEAQKRHYPLTRPTMWSTPSRSVMLREETPPMPSKP